MIEPARDLVNTLFYDKLPIKFFGFTICPSFYYFRGQKHTKNNHFCQYCK